MDDSAGEREWCLLFRLATTRAIGHNDVMYDVHEVL